MKGQEEVGGRHTQNPPSAGGSGGGRGRWRRVRGWPGLLGWRDAGGENYENPRWNGVLPGGAVYLQERWRETVWGGGKLGRLVDCTLNGGGGRGYA